MRRFKITKRFVYVFPKRLLGITIKISVTSQSFTVLKLTKNDQILTPKVVYLKKIGGLAKNVPFNFRKWGNRQIIITIGRMFFSTL